MNINNLLKKVLLEVNGEPEPGKTVSGQVDLQNPTSVLTHAINTPSCFKAKGYPITELRTASKELATACGVPEGTNYTEGKPGGDMTVYFFGKKDSVKKPNPDAEGATHFELCYTKGTTTTPIGKGYTWACKDAFAGISDINKAILSPEQESKLKTYVTTYGGVYSEFPPEDYTEQTYAKYDVKKIAALGDTFVDFPDGKMFVWVRLGLMNATPDQVKSVEKLLSGLTPSFTTKIPEVGTTSMSWCITAKGLFPTRDYFPLSSISYDNLKVRMDDPITGLKKGQWVKFCPNSDGIIETNKKAMDPKKCREAVRFLYSCKTKGNRSKYAEGGQETDADGTLIPGSGGCDDFKAQFKNRYLAFTCNSKKMYENTKFDVLGFGIKKEKDDLLNDIVSNFGLGTFVQTLKESVKISNTLDFTINKVVLEAIKNKKSKSVGGIESIVKKKLMEQIKRYGK